MAIPILVPPPRWKDEQLNAGIEKALATFRAERLVEPLEKYHQQFDAIEGSLHDLLELTVDLSQLEAQALGLMTDPVTFDMVRYLAAPPISEDDLQVIANVEHVSKKALIANPEDAVALVRTVLTALDRRRFPWVTEDRPPTEAERRAAALASAAMLAAQRVQTQRRNEGKDQQEQQVRDALLESGYINVPRRTISTLNRAPNIGEFCDESMLGGDKADLVVRLADGRLMPIECKVSNSYTNSIKRLNKDAAVKAVRWTQDFGQRHVVPVAVLSGAFRLRHLKYAQEHGLTLYWAHDLAEMIAWMNSLPGA